MRRRTFREAEVDDDMDVAHGGHFHAWVDPDAIVEVEPRRFGFVCQVCGMVSLVRKDRCHGRMRRTVRVDRAYLHFNEESGQLAYSLEVPRV